MNLFTVLILHLNSPRLPDKTAIADKTEFQYFKFTIKNMKNIDPLLTSPISCIFGC